MRIAKTMVLITVVVALLMAQGSMALAQESEEEDVVQSDSAPSDNEQAQWGVVSEEPPAEQGQVAPQEEESPPNAEQAPPDIRPGENLDVNYFVEALAPYGEWSWTSEYGWVWRPNGVWEGWRPYTYGRWINTEYGWYWHSYHPWGWAPFHYGNWAHLNYVGWVWVPGTVWAPAWVMWRYSDSLVGWAPLPPGYDSWYGWGFYPVFYDSWAFIDWRYYSDPHPYRHYVPNHQIRDVFRHSYFPHRCRENASGGCGKGFTEKFVSKMTKSPVDRYKVDQISARFSGSNTKNISSVTKIEGNTVRIYKPTFKASGTRMQAPNTKMGATRPQLNNTRPRVQDFGVVPDSNKPVQVDSRGVENASPQGVGVQNNNTQFDRRSEPGKSIYPRPPSTTRPNMPRPTLKYKDQQPSGHQPPTFKPSSGSNKPTMRPAPSAPSHFTPTKSFQPSKSPTSTPQPSTRSSSSKSPSSSSSSSSRSSTHRK